MRNPFANTLRIARSMIREVHPMEPPNVPEPFLAVGEDALRHTKTITSFGTRPPGSAAHERTQDYIASVMEESSCQWYRQPFTAQTPIGPIEMCNLVGKFGAADTPPRESCCTLLSGHYDTIRSEVVVPVGRAVKCTRFLRSIAGLPAAAATHFVGANDGGSSAGFLLAMARWLSDANPSANVWLAFFDGEEALVKWSENDQTYGSRHQAEVWKDDGSIEQVRAMVNVDMIAAKNVTLACELNSASELRKLVWRVAHQCGYGNRFPERKGKRIGDDHVPFIRAGVPAVDLIDIDYGPGNGFWHTLEDSMDKLSAHSFGMIAHVVSEVIAIIERDEL